jgi:nuclear cap-binding protein subunit 2
MDVLIRDGCGAAPKDTHTTNSTTIILPIVAIPRAPILQHIDVTAKLYWDRSHYSSPAEQMQALQRSATVYVGNVSFTTRSHHIQQHFTQALSTTTTAGSSSCAVVVKRIILGLDRVKKTPCGFGFVELYTRYDAVRAVSLLSGTRLDGRIIRVELDAGFQPGRQYGRGVSGGQVRNDIQKRIQQQQQQQQSGKRGRGDGDSLNTISQYGSSSNYSQLSSDNRTVRLDEALPSSRNQEFNSTSLAAPDGDAANGMADDDDPPPLAKRIRLE